MASDNDTRPGLHLHMGNRLETLAQELAGLLKRPLSSPFVPETILVQSRGMERWVSMALARHNGIFANGSFPFPNAFVDELCRVLFPDLPAAEESRFHPSVMTLKIFERLPECIGRKGFEALRGYLEDDGDKRKRMQLSERIADLFDQYLVFRPEMIFRWEAGRESHWQARLWRLLSQATDAVAPSDPHRARLHFELIEKLKDPGVRISALPERVSVFGISYLPPFHLEVLQALAGRIDVHLFFVNPCREYWADIAGRREMRRLSGRYPGRNLDPAADLHLEEGNRLLAATGSVGRDFLHLVSGADAHIRESFTKPGADRLLHRVQSDILALKNPQDNRPPEAADRSIEIHSCHGPMREIEVLYDRLLAMFEEIPGLRPRDVLVMTPDIEALAPLIHAVFDVPADEGLRIPYSVADRSARRESTVAEGLLRLMALAESRMPADKVLELLEVLPIRRRFDIAESEIGLLARWTAESGIRWGRDAESRAALGLPAVAENTWRAGIDRLLLGWAIAGEDETFEGISPFGQIEESDARLLGRFLGFLEALFTASDRLAQAHPAGRWSGLLDGVLAEFFERSEDLEPEFAALSETLSGFSRAADSARCREPIGCAVVRSWLEAQLERHSFGSGFISGGVTFGAMVPMRSIPFKVVCMIGMNSGAFPREGRRLSFDLTAARPRPGDRSRRDDDKYLFLEAIVSARERLYISYTGQSLQDNSPLPPSVLVSELADALVEGYGVLPDALVVRHPLQAFSPENFGKNDRLFSYSEQNRLAAESLLADKSAAVFFDRPLPLSPAETEQWRTLTPELLCEFFTHPTRFLLRRRLGIHLGTDPVPTETSEAFALDGLQSFRLGQELVQRFLKGEAPAPFYALARAKGQLPHGSAGEVDFSRLCAEARGFVENVKRLAPGPLLDPEQIRIDAAGFELRGRLEELCEEGLCRLRFARMRSVDLLSGWIRHLILCIAGPRKIPLQTLLFFKDGSVRFGPVQAPRDVLSELLGHFRSGLVRPLPFFPRTSEAYARKRADGAGRQDALVRARRIWRADFGFPESDDPYYRCCFKEKDPLDEAFEKTAASVWTPLLLNQEQIFL